MDSIPYFYWIIWVTAFFTAIVSAVVGMVGGTLLLAVMAQFLKMEVLIPIHGLIQFSSNGTRAWFLRSSIDKWITIENFLGILIGSYIGAKFVINVPSTYYNLLLGLFILAITYAPKFQTPLQFRGRWFFLGLITIILSLYFGAVGLIVGAVFLAEKIPKRTLISTQAMCQANVHLMKVLVFIGIGFAIQKWLILILGGIVMTYFGSYIGTRVLDKIPERIFRITLKITVTVLALRLIYFGIKNY